MKIVKVEADPCPNLVEKYKVQLCSLCIVCWQSALSGCCFHLCKQTHADIAARAS